jgi:hypothetical protein
MKTPKGSGGDDLYGWLRRMHILTNESAIVDSNVPSFIKDGIA